MVSLDKEQNIRAAESLRLEALAQDLSYGCLEISLAALGAQIAFQDLERRGRKPSQVFERIERTGLRINWQVGTTDKLSGDDISYVLGGSFNPDQRVPDGTLMGYLWMEQFPNGEGHTLAIFPNESEPYLVIDTIVGGYILLSSADIAHLANHVVSQGGSFLIAQIKS